MNAVTRARDTPDPFSWCPKCATVTAMLRHAPRVDSAGTYSEDIWFVPMQCVPVYEVT